MEAIMNAIPEYRHSVMIWKVIPPLLILVGVPGNVLTIVVLMQRRSRGSSTAIYLTALALADLCVLGTGLLRQWIKYLFELDIRYLSNFGCKLHIFVVYFGTQCSSWMLVAVTIERFIGVWAPHRVKRGCRPRSAAVVIVIIVVCISLLNLHWFIGLDEVSYVRRNVTHVRLCTPVYDMYSIFLNFTWPWVDLCVFCLVPFSILVMGNMSILIKVLISRRKTLTQINPVQSSDVSNTTQARGASSSVQVKRKDDKTSQLAVTLFILNAVFLVCVTPISIYLIGQPHWYSAIETYKEYAIMQLWWAVVNVFMYLNNTLNFVLYFFGGSRFRGEVKALFFGKAGSSRGLFGTTIPRVAPTASPRQSTATTALRLDLNPGETTGKDRTEEHELQQY